MKKLFLISATLLAGMAHAQQGEWTWITGSSGNNGSPVYGIKGVPDPANTPAATYESVGWTDTQGNLWLFGGLKDLANEFNTLWKFDPVSKMWTWMDGSTGCCASGSYGTIGVPSVNNRPGARAWGSYTWVDNDGNFWLYGGVGYNLAGFVVLNDLWMYNPVTAEWTWVAGSKNNMIEVSYGTKGIPDSSNTPGARCEANATWVDDDNNLWLFGGALYNGSPGNWSIQGFANDLWMFDRSINQWVWVSGTSSLYDPGNYGTKGIPSANNLPPARGSYASFEDDNDQFYLFAGYDLGSAWNDLWKYTPATNEWTWLSGPNTPNTGPVSGTVCVPDAANVPSNRFENRMAWKDPNGDFWTWGGVRNGFNEIQNDLWKYSVGTNEWAWVSGSTTANGAGNYGVKGVSDPANMPPPKYGGMAWIDHTCNFWVFGGSVNFTARNDLWRYVPDPDCPVQNICALPPSVAFSATDTSLCEKFCIDFLDLSAGNPLAWLWSFEGGVPATSTDQNPTGICYDNPGTFDVTLITTYTNGDSDTLTLTDYISVYQNPFAPLITQDGNTLTSSGAATYQWYQDGILIAGATNQTLEITESGLYTVEITDDNGCSSQATIKAVLLSTEDASENVAVDIVSNPVTHETLIRFLGTGRAKYALVNVLGQILHESVEFISGNKIIPVSMQEYPAGLYFLQIEFNGKTFPVKLVKQ